MEDNLKVLVVDDSKTMLLRASLMLKKNGFIPVTMSEALDVLETIKREKVAVVILDVEMPGITGYQLCDMIKNDDETEDIPVIFFTSRDEYMDRLRGYSLGAQGYLVKDCDEDEFIGTIKKLLSEK
ncbi:MAG: response regulator [Planctomycetes bacterium]|nr:response regulator [Planctomycetota bacterium]